MILVNATAIGCRFSGIGRYALSLVRQLLKTHRADLHVFVNESAFGHFTAEERAWLICVRGGISPDLGFKGHIRRLVWGNWLRLACPEGLIFNVSPLEGCIVGSRQVLTIHDLIPLRVPRASLKQYPYFKYWLPRVLARTGSVIAVSRSTKDQVSAEYAYPANRIHVIYHGVARIFRQPNIDGAGRSYLLYVGRLTPAKNLLRLLDAHAQVRRKYGQIALKVVGNCAPPVKLPDGVEMLGWVPDHELVRLYRGAQLLVCPSLAEGFGLVALEAMAGGCPVVASNIPAIREVCGDAAWYVSPDSTDSIAGGMCEVLDDGNLRCRLAKEGLERAQTFTWEAAAESHLRVFDEALRNEGAPSGESCVHAG
jgi:glycosyltransferase involved in cell wall biosynthesis